MMFSFGCLTKMGINHKVHNMLLLSLILFVSIFAYTPVMAQDDMRYQGFLDVRVIEPNQAQYILGVKFRSGYSKPIDFTLRPFNGKANVARYRQLFQQSDGEDKRAFNLTDKYYFSMRIREDNHQSFAAVVKLFRRAQDKVHDINQAYQFNPDDFNLIEERPISGQFNIDNEYLFVDSAQLKFYLKLNFDVIFTREEIVERFKQGKHQTK